MLENNTERNKTINGKPEVSIPKVSQSEVSTSETALPEAANLRRQRYARHASPPAFVSLIPIRVRILCFLAELQFLSLPQIAKLCCPAERQDLSEKSARRHMRSLFDAGLVDVLPVSRAALAPAGAPNDASLLYGSAPNVYALTAPGLGTLRQAGLIDLPPPSRKKPNYGPRNSLFLAHGLAVRDVRVWLETLIQGQPADSNSGRNLTAKHRLDTGNMIEAWHHGEDAAIDLERTQAPYCVRPDAWFALRLPQAVLVGLVEVDRSTERGERRWQEKLAAYGALFVSGRLRGATGYVNARVLVTCPTEGRREQLAALIGRAAGPELAKRFWLSKDGFRDPQGLTAPAWQRPGNRDLQSLVLPALLNRP